MIDENEGAGIKSTKRDEWEVKDDLRAIKRTIDILKDKERLEEVQEMMKVDSEREKSLQLFADGDLKKALGL